MEALVPRLKAELLERGAYYPKRVAWGRKPPEDDDSLTDGNCKQG
jgi:hypothetical protein